MDLGEAVRVLYDVALVSCLAIVYFVESVVLTLIPRRFRGKTISGEIALVTGAGNGLGRLIALKLAKLGAQVVAWDIDEAGLKETVRLIKNDGGQAWGYRCDLTDRKSIYQTAKTVVTEVGSVTILVNNAGYVCGKTLLNLPDGEIERTFKVNLLSHYSTTKYFLDDMMKNNHGHVVTIASVAGLLGTYGCTDYSATKFGAVGFHESLYTELKAHGYDGVHATVVCPYFINTGMFNGVKPRLLPMLEPEYVAEETVFAILTNKVDVVLPLSVKFLLPLKFLLPAKTSWALMHRILRGPQSMMLKKSEIEGDVNGNVSKSKIQ